MKADTCVYSSEAGCRYIDGVDCAIISIPTRIIRIAIKLVVGDEAIRKPGLCAGRGNQGEQNAEAEELSEVLHR